MSGTNKDTPALFKSLGSVSGVTLLSRVLGYLRDMVIAVTFGASAGTDVFFVANRIPNFFRRLFGEGAFSQAFVPILSEYQQKQPEQVKDLVDHVVGLLFIVVTVITVVAVITAPWLVLVVAPGFSDDAQKLQFTSDLLRITFPYLLMISLSAASMAILNSRGVFAAPAFSPVLLNVSMILSAWFLADLFPEPLRVTALAWGVFFGGVAQLVWQVPFLLKIGLMPRLRFKAGHAGVKRVLTLMIPTLFGAGVAQINLLFDTFLASFPAWLWAMMAPLFSIIMICPWAPAFRPFRKASRSSCNRSNAITERTFLPGEYQEVEAVTPCLPAVKK